MRISIVAISFIFLTACGKVVDPSLLQPATFNYPTSVINGCEAVQKTGATGIINDIQTTTGAHYNLRTPANYNSTVAHPLIVVFAPAGTSASKSERYVHLTSAATQAGFIIAYAKNMRMSLRTIKKLSAIPLDIQQKWCIDASRIYYTGHSDGGTITNALAFLPSSTNKPTAIAPSAAGIDAKSLKQYTCPSPLPVMVFHNHDDSHFAGFGKQAADWWANCNQCSNQTTAPDRDGCRAYKDCLPSAKTYFCEAPGSHSTWPDKNNVMINFFVNHQHQTP